MMSNLQQVVINWMQSSQTGSNVLWLIGLLGMKNFTLGLGCMLGAIWIKVHQSNQPLSDNEIRDLMEDIKVMKWKMK